MHRKTVAGLPGHATKLLTLNTLCQLQSHILYALTQDYATADEFFEAVLQAWNAEWQRVYAFDWAESQPFEDGGVDYAVFYTPSIKILSILSQGDYSHNKMAFTRVLSTNADASGTCSASSQPLARLHAAGPSPGGAMSAFTAL